MRAEFWPPTFWLSLVLFASSFILFFFPPLTLFTIFFTLHFLLRPTISSLKNYSPKLLNPPSLISLNIFFQILAFLSTFATYPFWWNPFSNSYFLRTKMSSSSNGPSFLLFMERNIIHHLNGMMRRGSFKTPRPILHIPIWTLRWVFLCLEKCCFHASLKDWWWDIVILLCSLVGI